MKEITYSWPELKSFGRLATQMFHLGDTKTDTLSDGTEIQFRLIGFNHDHLPDGQVAPMTWQAVNCLPKGYLMNAFGASVNSWEDTSLRQEMNSPEGEIYLLMPAELREVVTPVVKEAAGRDRRMVETVDAFWLQSECEILGLDLIAIRDEGRQYSWYEGCMLERFKKLRMIGLNAAWWLRSLCGGDGFHFCGVSSGGGIMVVSIHCCFGVAPAFCL